MPGMAAEALGNFALIYPHAAASKLMSSYSSDLNAILDIFCSMAKYQQSMVINELQKTLDRSFSEQIAAEAATEEPIPADPPEPSPRRLEMPKPKPKLRTH